MDRAALAMVASAGCLALVVAIRVYATRGSSVSTRTRPRELVIDLRRPRPGAPPATVTALGLCPDAADCAARCTRLCSGRTRSASCAPRSVTGGAPVAAGDAPMGQRVPSAVWCRGMSSHQGPQERPTPTPTFSRQILRRAGAVLRGDTTTLALVPVTRAQLRRTPPRLPRRMEPCRRTIRLVSPLQNLSMGSVVGPSPAPDAVFCSRPGGGLTGLHQPG